MLPLGSIIFQKKKELQQDDCSLGQQPVFYRFFEAFWNAGRFSEQCQLLTLLDL
jgi:hypothetical protein